MRTARCKHIYEINGLNDFFFSLFACSELNCTYLFIYSAVKWNQHHILVMIECSNREEGGRGTGHGQLNKRYSGMILNWSLVSFIFHVFYATSIQVLL